MKLILIRELNEMTMTELNVAVNILNKTYSKIGVEINPSFHFTYDRALLGKRDDIVTPQQIISSLKLAFDRHYQDFIKYESQRKEYIGLIKDYRHDLNIIFSIHYERGKSHSKDPIFKDGRSYKMNIISMMVKNPDRYMNDNFKTDNKIIIAADKIKDDTNSSRINNNTVKKQQNSPVIIVKKKKPVT